MATYQTKTGVPLVEAVQFDPAKPYPDGAWAFGPMDFRCATARGNVPIVKGDWIVSVAGERLVMPHGVFETLFEPPAPKPKKKAEVLN
jgi:hypothetical protein